MYLTGIIVKPD